VTTYLEASTTTAGANVGFKVNGEWAPDELMVESVDFGDVVTKTFTLDSWPEQVRMIVRPPVLDAWGYQTITLKDIATNTIWTLLEPCTGNACQWYVDSPYWTDMLTEYEVYDVPTGNCSAPVSVANSASSHPCAEGDVISNGGVCSAQCEYAHRPTTWFPSCLFGTLSPATFECVFVPCDEAIGNLSRPECICNTSQAPVNGGLGDCEEILHSGRTCTPECLPGFCFEGSTSCLEGNLTTATCTAYDCNATAAMPRHMDLGACPPVLDPGEVCTTSCHPVYTLTGNTSCSECGLSWPSCFADLTIEVETSSVARAQTGSGALVAIEVAGVWQPAEVMCDSASQGEVVRKAVRATDWPSRLRLRAQGTDGWGFRRISAILKGDSAVVLEDDGDVSYTFSSPYWVDQDEDGTEEHVYDIPLPLCNATQLFDGLPDFADSPCAEGPIIEYNSHCTLQCAFGCTPSEASVRCAFTTFSPSTALCLQDPCFVGQAPMHGSLGDCPELLTSGASCQPTCDAGYVASGRTHCLTGELTRATCLPMDCNTTESPEHGTRGDCPETLISGAACRPGCDQGYHLRGESECLLGVLTSSVCVPNPCEVDAFPAHSSRGDCPTQLESEETCQPLCEAGYHITEAMSCYLNDIFMPSCVVRLELSVTTSNHTWSDTLSGADAVFYVQGAWTSREVFTTSASLGMTVSKAFELADWPAYVALIARGVDDWSFYGAKVTSRGVTTMLLGVGDNTTLSMNATNTPTGVVGSGAGRRMSDSDSAVKELMATVTGIPKIYEAPEPKCPAPLSIANVLAEGPCAEGGVMNHGSGCTTQCAEGYYPSVAFLACSLGALGPSVFECLEKPCNASQAPEHGSSGTCHEALPSQASCHFACDEGYELSGPTKCLRGNLSEATCLEGVCDASTEPSGMERGDCPAELASGASCQRVCPAGYTPTSRTTCSHGKLTEPTCFPTTCSPMLAPSQGGFGNCPSSLAHGASCQSACLPGYTSAGNTTCNFGVLTVAECMPDACSVGQAPAHGSNGTCGSLLPSGGSCRPACDPGFALVGKTSCFAGTLVPATCGPAPCSIAVAPANGNNGDCPALLLSGASCQPECNPGHVVSGPLSCFKGTISPATCTPMPCDSRQAPIGGSVGDCPGFLPSGGACVPSCNTGYKREGVTRCLLGVLTKATCVPPCDVTASLPHSSLGTCPALLESGQVCQLECETGYMASGNTSCESGRLTTSPCSPLPCGVHVPPEHGHAGDCPHFLESGASCQPGCHSGYRIIGRTSCLLGQVTPARCEAAQDSVEPTVHASAFMGVVVCLILVVMVLSVALVWCRLRVVATPVVGLRSETVEKASLYVHSEDPSVPPPAAPPSSPPPQGKTLSKVLPES